MESIEQRRARRFNRLWEAYQAEGKQEPEPGTTYIKTTRAGRRFQRALELREIRKHLAQLPEGERPIIRQHGGDLILDFGIYQTHHDLRSFRVEVHGDTIGGMLRRAEKLATGRKDSALAMEAHDAKVCLRCVEGLRKALTNIDAFGENTIVANSLTQHHAIVLVQLGKLMERLESAYPGQRDAVKAKRSRVGARKIRHDVSQRLHSKRHASVAAEIKRQKLAGEALRF